MDPAAQALGSKNCDGFLGTQSKIGCFSLSVAKIISSGQGGFLVTDDDNLAQKLRAIRTHGVESVKDPSSWPMLGFNFRFTDVLASIGLAQLSLIDQRVEKLLSLYEHYVEGVSGTNLKIIPMDLEHGEVPLYVECVVDMARNDWTRYLDSCDIDTRPFYPSIHRAPYLGTFEKKYPNSLEFEKRGLYLPSGPCQPLTNADICIEAVKNRS